MKINPDGSWALEWAKQHTKLDERQGWTLDWVQQRVKLGHHRVLTKYLVQRSPVQAGEADSSGLTVPEILRKAFLVKNGHIAVPEDAMKVLRNVEGARPEDVWAIVEASEARSEEAVEKRLSTFKRAVMAWAKRTGGDPSPWINRAIVQEVMTR